MCGVSVTARVLAGSRAAYPSACAPGGAAASAIRSAASPANRLVNEPMGCRYAALHPERQVDEEIGTRITIAVGIAVFLVEDIVPARLDFDVLAEGIGRRHVEQPIAAQQYLIGDIAV